jgi:predicted transport protein
MLMTVDDSFEGRARSRRLYEAIARQIAAIGKTTIRVSKSQIAFRRRRNVAAVWIPGRYLAGETAPLVLTLSFPRPDSSSRWKEIVQIGPGRFTHHLELYKVSDVDEQVKIWLQAAWDAA